MPRLRDTIASFTMLAGAVAAPVATGAYLLAESSPPPDNQLAVLSATALHIAEAGTTPGAAATPSGETARPARREGVAAPLVLGILHTRGEAAIDWNGARILVQDGRYPYVGGEQIRVASDGMGVLQLGRSGALVACPGSESRLTRDGNVYWLDIDKGKIRFMFGEGVPFRVSARGVILTGGQGSAPGIHLAEVNAGAGSSLLVWGLQGGFQVGERRNDITTGIGALPADGPEGVLVDVRTGKTPGQQSAMVALDVPAAVRLQLGARAALPADLANGMPTGAMRYLCRSDEVADYARYRAAALQTAALTEPAQRPDQEPPVEPPDVPPVALAPPVAPDLFDPNVLPPPAAGPDITVVPPPLVPVSGTGGGIPVSTL